MLICAIPNNKYYYYYYYYLMINTAPPASNSVYGREKLFWYGKINFFLKIMCVTVVQWSRSCLQVQINRVRFPASDAVLCFLVPFFFSCLVSFFNTIFPFDRFFFILTADPPGHALGSIYILSLSPEFYFGKGISKALDLHTGQAYDQIKTISCQDMSLLWNSWIFFNVSWHHDKQHTVHHKLY